MKANFRVKEPLTAILIHPLESGLFRIQIRKSGVAKTGVTVPLVSGMVVNRRVLGKWDWQIRIWQFLLFKRILLSMVALVGWYYKQSERRETPWSPNRRTTSKVWTKSYRLIQMDKLIISWIFLVVLCHTNVSSPHLGRMPSAPLSAMWLFRLCPFLFLHEWKLKGRFHELGKVEALRTFSVEMEGGTVFSDFVRTSFITSLKYKTLLTRMCACVLGQGT